MLLENSEEILFQDESTDSENDIRSVYTLFPFNGAAPKLSWRNYYSNYQYSKYFKSWRQVWGIKEISRDRNISRSFQGELFKLQMALKLGESFIDCGASLSRAEQFLINERFYFIRARETVQQTVFPQPSHSLMESAGRSAAPLLDYFPIRGKIL